MKCTSRSAIILNSNHCLYLKVHGKPFAFLNRVVIKQLTKYNIKASFGNVNNYFIFILLRSTYMLHVYDADLTFHRVTEICKHWRHDALSNVILQLYCNKYFSNRAPVFPSQFAAPFEQHSWQITRM